MKILKLLLLILGIAIVASCSKNKNVSSLKPGMSKQAIISALGNPDSSSSSMLKYKEEDGITLEVYMHRGKLSNWRRKRK